MTPARLVRHLRLSGDVRGEVIRARQSFDAAAEREALVHRGISFVGRDEFPRRLREIYDPPFGLFVRSAGTTGIDDGDRPVVAIVGARRATVAGRDFARRLSRELAERGALVISGLARGIDGAAHSGALEGGGRTHAVLGSGVDVPYPRRNQGLADRVIESGALISEYWPGTTPAPWHFPARNRIVSGLAHATVVVEAGERSGALITADFAAEHGRQVLAVPGAPWCELAAGANALIRAGAALCESIEDVVAELAGLAWAPPGGDGPPRLSDEASDVLQLLQEQTLDLDGLAACSAHCAADLLRLLGELELAGCVGRAGAGRWRALSPR